MGITRSGGYANAMTLDDAFDAEKFRTTGHRWVDQMADYLCRAAAGQEMPVLPYVPPAEMLEGIAGDFPSEPGGDLLDQLETLVASSNHLHHPRYIGHQVATVLPHAALIEATNALLNNGMAVYEMGQMQTAMERRVVEYLGELLGFPADADGILTHGGSAGNLTALLAARQAKAGHDVWTDGQSEPFAVLVSEQAHYCIARAVQIMGWGAGGAIPIATDDKFRITKKALRAGYDLAEQQGRRVLAVVASSCTTATGSFDPLEEVAEFCKENELWLHVDGAHGASLAFSEKHGGRLAGIEHADSVVWDLHKLALMPALVTAVLFREGRRSYESFAQEASYLFESPDPGIEWSDVGRRTLECTKRGLGVTAFTMLQTYGTRMFGDHVDLLIERTQQFAAMLDDADDFEIATEPEVNILCFRHKPATCDDVDALNRRLRDQLLRSGEFYIVQTQLRGATWLRITIMNPTTSLCDLEHLLGRLRELA